MQATDEHKFLNEDTIQNLEHLLDSATVDDVVKDKIQETLCLNFKTNIAIANCISKEYREFSKKLSETRQFSSNNYKICFTNAGKGNLSVCMYVSEYNNRMERLLSDKRIYKQRKINSSESLRKRTSTVRQKGFW